MPHTGSNPLPSSEESCELRYGPRRPACDPYAPYGRFPKRRSCRSTQEGAVAHKCRDGRDHHGRNRRHLPPAELGESRRRDGPWARFCESAEQPDKRGSACRPRRLTGSRACEKPAENPAGKGEKGDKRARKATRKGASAVRYRLWHAVRRDRETPRLRAVLATDQRPALAELARITFRLDVGVRPVTQEL